MQRSRRLPLEPEPAAVGNVDLAESPGKGRSTSLKPKGGGRAGASRRTSTLLRLLKHEAASGAREIRRSAGAFPFLLS